MVEIDGLRTSLWTSRSALGVLRALVRGFQLMVCNDDAHGCRNRRTEAKRDLKGRLNVVSSAVSSRYLDFRMMPASRLLDSHDRQWRAMGIDDEKPRP